MVVPFDVVITDMNMPVMGGKEMVAAIQLLLKDSISPTSQKMTADNGSQNDDLESHNPAPLLAPLIIGVTGDALPKDILAYEQLGISAILVKPFDGRKILQCIRSVTAAASMAGTSLR
jgi:CheY-like chemotaxis protein